MAFRRVRLLTIGAALLVPAAQGFAQEPCPSHPVKIIVPFTPGSVTDIMARSVSDKLTRAAGDARRPAACRGREGELIVT
jgi:tripartite-type tricarboxylate transporter receptor subunit TctC